MLYQVRAYIDKHRLLSASDKVLVGLSGGADSVALLSVLVKLGYTCIALHCNFHLRGEESVRDEKFAQAFADKLHVPLYKIDFKTEQYAHENHLSIEMAARELRYAWFEDMRIRLQAQAIAVAHHRDDSIETLLMNLVRGSGIRGLVGIRPRNQYVIRPLLAVSRKEILSWLEEQQYTYVTDSTNLSDAYTRNFIRLRVLPLLEEINPSVRQTLSRTADHLSAAETIYLSVLEKAHQELWVKDKLSIEKLMQYPSPETILYELLQPFGFSRQVASDVFRSLEGESGKVFYSDSYRLVKDREYLLLSKREQISSITYTYPLEAGLWQEPFSFSFEMIQKDADFTFQVSKDIAYFDADKLDSVLQLRRWQQGDWFIPFGMKGRKKVSDYFSDHKFTLEQKENAWLLCSGQSVIWLVGERSDNRFRVSADTKRILIVKKFA
ncbi:MAG: tRNA lysidine(34) synthetase TilS [Bacteroidales bacterium]|nr:tRNA lysidine(34) synthetase TilS [Parabacteroides sp.]MDY5622172.1 tRNA lysidine(34) synthetase TilS [Bacteroidales bacterium]